MTKAERDALVVGGTVRGQPARGVMPLCRKLAGDHAKRVLADRGRRFDVDDLEGDALAAAVEAAKYYDPDHGAAFTSFVTQYVHKAMLESTSERHKPLVRAWPKEGDDGERFEAADREEHEPDDLDHFDYLTADQRAAFDLIPAGVGKDVIRLMLRGYDRHQIEQQTGMLAKDVTLHVRNAVVTLRKAGLVPFDLDPYPNEANRQAESWEREKAANRARAERQAETERKAAAAENEKADRRRRAAERAAVEEARRQAQAKEAEYLARLADRLRPLLADRPRAKAAELADRLTAAGGAKVYAVDVAKAVKRFKLRPPRVNKAASETAVGA